MTDLRKAAEQALEALEELYNTNNYWWQEVDEQTFEKIKHSITAIKEALAQPEQKQALNGWRLVPIEPTEEMLRSTEAGPVNYPAFCWKAMLYAAPNPPQRKPHTA